MHATRLSSELTPYELTQILVEEANVQWIDSPVTVSLAHGRKL